MSQSPDADTANDPETDPETPTDEDPGADAADPDETEPDADAPATAESPPPNPDADHDVDEDTPFEAIAEAEILQDFVAKPNVLVEECKLHLTPDRVETTAVDPANVAMVDNSLFVTAFESYAVHGEQLVGINLSRLDDVLAMADADDLVHLVLDGESRKLHIQYSGLEYTLALINPDTVREEPDIPDLNLAGEVKVEGRQIDRAITAADMVSDHLRLSIDETDELFIVEAEGDTDDVHLELGEDDLEKLTAGAADSLFSIDYWKDLNKAIDAETPVRMELGEEFPVLLHFQYADGGGQTTFMLAPRIQSN